METAAMVVLVVMEGMAVEMAAMVAAMVAVAQRVALAGRVVMVASQVGRTVVEEMGLVKEGTAAGTVAVVGVVVKVGRVEDMVAMVVDMAVLVGLVATVTRVAMAGCLAEKKVVAVKVMAVTSECPAHQAL